MAETISLRAYLGKVEDLLSVGQTDEVIHHCRHILQYFPRNVAAYLLLGRALLQKRRWDEARAVFLRVLSARPDDFDAHVGLCEVDTQKGQTNDAIWHLERAFEQRPADHAVTDRLREMYRQHRNVNQTRMQLTTAAVARQQTSAGFNARALDTLRAVLSRTPDRIDLRLLLAQTLWNNDQRIEAAETALDVLEKLPDCIEANAIMTQLWLSEDRPSDAQRFLNRLEATDPYRALEIVQGQPAPDESFMLDELDYRRYAQREMATSRPDWLEGLDTDEFKDLFGDTSPRAASGSMTDRLRPSVPAAPAPDAEDWPDLFTTPNDGSTADEPRTLPTTSDLFGDNFPPAKAGPTTDDLFGDLPDEWSAEWAASAAAEPDEEPPPPPAPAQAAPKSASGLLRALQSEANTVQPTAARPEQKQSGRLFDVDDPMDAAEPPKPLEGKSTATSDLPDWLQNTEESIRPAEATSGLRSVKPAENGAWLYENGDEQNIQKFIEDDEPITIPPENIDPMAWLRATGAEINEEGQRVRPSMYDDGGDGGIVADPSADPLSWMKDSGIELEEQAPDSLTGGNSGGLEWMNSKTLPDVDLEAAAIEARGSTDVDFFTWLEEQQQSNRVNADDVTIDDDPLEWLSNGDLLADLDADDDIPGEVDPQRPFDWPGEQAGDELAQFDDQVPAHILKQTQEWELDPDRASEQDRFAPTNQANEAERQTAMADQGGKQGPDWLNNNSDDDLEWLNGAQDSDANAHLADWLNQGLDDDDEADDEAASLADFDWVDAKESESESSVEPEPAVPDWLSDLGQNYTQPEKTLYAAGAGEPEPVEETPAESAEMPDWLSGLGINYTQPETLPTFAAEEPEAAAEPESSPEIPTLAQADWGDEQADDEQQPLAQPAMPDWMSALDPQTAVSMSTVTDEPEDEDAAVPADVPDWMASMKPEEASDTPDWMSGIEPDAEPDVPMPAGVADWMASLEPEETSSDSALEWLDSSASAPQPDVETPAAIKPPGTAEMLDWISDLTPAETPDNSLFNELGNEVIDTPLADVPPAAVSAEPALPVAGSAADWMSSLEPEAADDSSLQWLEGETPEPAAELPSSQPNASSFDWVNDLSGRDEPESALDDWMASTPSSLSEIAAAEQPPVTDFEWLSAARQDADNLEPQGDDEPEVDISEPAASGGFNWPSDNDSASSETVGEADVPDWLQELNPAEEAPAAQAEPSFSWLDIGSSEPTAQPETASEMPDWLSDMSPEADTEAEPAASVEEIDWLSGIGKPSSAAAEAEPVEAASQFDYAAASSSLFDPVEEDAMDVATADRPAPAVTQLLDGDFELPAASSESVVAEHVPAENAPDWLNAMVPGVDLDYAPAEDEALEPAEAEPVSPTQPYDWLIEIAEEETQPASESQTLQESEPVAAQMDAKPKFAFSKLPSWLRKDNAATR